MTDIQATAAKLSDAKWQILRDAPADWFSLNDHPWPDNVKLGTHLQQMQMAGLIEFQYQDKGCNRKFRLTDAGRGVLEVMRATRS